MRIRINFRFALYLILAVAAVATGAHFLHAYQVSRNAENLRQRAEQLQEQGDLSKAADYLGQYLGMNPTDVAVQAQYGLLMANDQVAKTPQSKYRALLTLEKVLVRKPDERDVRRRAVQVAMDIGYYAGARDNLLYLLPTKSLPKDKNGWPKDPEIALKLAQCLDALSDLKSARFAYENAITVVPHDLDAYARLAALLRLRTDDVLTSEETAKETAKDRANKVIKTMVEANQNSYRAFLLHAQYVRTFPEPAGPDAADIAKKQKEITDNIATDLARAATLAPDEADVLIALAEQAKQIQDQTPLARTRLQRCCSLHPKDWRSYLVLAQIDTKEGKTDQAIASLDRGLAQVPDSVELHRERATLLVDAGRGKEAEKSIDTLPPEDRLFLQGRVAMRAERWLDAIDSLEKAYDGLLTRADRLKDESAEKWAEQAGLCLAECYQQVGNVGRAQSVYSRVVAHNPKSTEGRLGVATTCWAQGRLQEALDQYRVIVRLRRDLISGWVGVARLAMLNLQRERDPAKRNWEEVENALDQVKELAKGLKPKPTSVAILEADYLATKENIDNSRKFLEGSYPDQASRPAEVWVALATLEDWQGRSAKALACLDDALRFGGDRVELRLARANHLVRRGEGKANDALRALAQDVDRFSDADRRQLFRGLAIVYTQAKMTAEARDLWLWLAAKHPNDLPSRLALFDLAASDNDEAARKDMDRLQNQIRKIEGDDGVIWRQARISVLLTDAQKRSDLSGLSDAKKLLAQIAARQPDSPRVPLNGARIADVEGRPDDAVPLYLRAIQLGERDPAALARTYNLLVERGRLTEANDVATYLPNPSSSDPTGLRAFGEVALRSNNLDRAKIIAENVVEAAPDDYRGYLLRGQTRWAAARTEEKLKEAEADFQRARDLAPSEPATWLTLVQFLIATKQKDQALAAADAAQGVLAGPKGLSALARINNLIGRADRAADMVRAALTAAGDKPDPEVLTSAAMHYLASGKQKEADDLLDRLSKGPDSKLADQARFLRSAMKVAGNGPDALEEAKRLMTSNEAGLTLAEKIQQQRSNAQLLAIKPFRDRRQRAVRLLENLIDNQLATPADHLLTAQLYEWLGDVAKARARYTALLTLPGANSPEIFAAAGQFLVRHGDLDGAAIALRGLDDQPRQAAAANILRARLLHAQNQTKKAKDLLKESADKDGTDRSAVAGVLEEIGEFDEAERQLDKFLNASPRSDSVLTRAKFLVRRKRFEEALNVCDGAWSHCPPVAVADTCIAALSQMMPPDASAVGRVAERIEAAHAKSPDDTALLAAVAVVRNFQGRFDDSEALYRRILTKDPGHSMALNNLAWLLALKSGHADEAVVLIDRAIQASGIDPNLLDTRAVAFLALNKADFAINDLDKVIDTSPTPTAYFHLAQAYLQGSLQGRPAWRNKALEAWKKANERTRLTPEELHPLERAAFDRLTADLGSPR
jgi:predicted Zn-dependent protease